MPIYENKCRKCGHKFELLQRLGATNEGISCPDLERSKNEKI
jgi:putative FmdB family regulatory protein